MAIIFITSSNNTPHFQCLLSPDLDLSSLMIARRESTMVTLHHSIITALFFPSEDSEEDESDKYGEEEDNCVATMAVWWLIRI